VVETHLVLRNTGSTTWSDGEGFRVAYHWLRGDGEVAVWDGMRTLLPAPVAGGEEVEVVARVVAPAAAGEYRLHWDVVQEGVCWFSEETGKPAAGIPVAVEVGHAFSVVQGRAPRWLWRGSEARVRLVIRNDGATRWSQGQEFAVSYHWRDRAGTATVWDGVRSALPRAVAPGETVEVVAAVQAPLDGSNHPRLQWDMVHEGVCWFSERDPSPEPSRQVLVVPGPVVGLAAAASLALVLGLAATWIGRRQRPRWLLTLLSVVDVVWLVGVLCLLQGLVLAEAGHPGTASAWRLMFGTAAVLALALLLIPGRARPWVGWLAALLATALLYVDIVYCRYFGDIVSAAVLSAAGQTGQVRASVASLLEVRDLWLLAVVGCGLVLALAAASLQRRVGRRPQLALAALLVPLVVVGVGAGAEVVRSDSGVLHQVFRSVFVAQEVGVLNFHLLDLTRYVRDEVLRPRPTEEHVLRVARWFAERAPLRQGRGPWFGRARGANLLMLQVESLQAFVIGFEVAGQEVTPALNRWARDNLRFDAVNDQTHHGRSSDCELATQVSLLPLSQGTAAFRCAGNDFTGIAEVLAGHGYSSLSAVPFTGSFWNRRNAHWAYGFSASLFDRDFAPGEVIGWGLNDSDFLLQMVPRLKALERPFCAFLITLSLHHPFAGFPEHHKVLNLGRLEGQPIGNYLHTMHFFDQAFARFMAELEAQGVADDTVIALWGDHDAGLGWDPEIAAALGTRWHEPDWYLTERVPLVIRAPGGAAESVGCAAGQADVAPTLLALLGVDPAPYAFVGRNLLGAPGSEPVPGAYGSWVDSRHLYVERGASPGHGRCYELATLEMVAPEDCREGSEQVRVMLEMSQSVLEDDLQQRVHELREAEGVAEGGP